MSEALEEYPEELFGGVSVQELATRISRFRVLQELGYFGLKTNISLSRGEYDGHFNAGVRKRFSGIYGNTYGCAAGDIEVAAELLGQDDFNNIYDNDEPRKPPTRNRRA